MLLPEQLLLSVGFWIFLRGYRPETKVSFFSVGIILKIRFTLPLASFRNSGYLLFGGYNQKLSLALCFKICGNLRNRYGTYRQSSDLKGSRLTAELMTVILLLTLPN